MYPVPAYPNAAYPSEAFPHGQEDVEATLGTSIALRYADGYGFADLTPPHELLDAAPTLGVVVSGGYGLDDASALRGILALSPPWIAPSETTEYGLRDVTARRDLVPASPQRGLVPAGGYGIEDFTAQRIVRKSQ